MSIPHPRFEKKVLGNEPATVLALDAVAKALGEMRYGSIALTVHDGRIVQLDVTERQRFV